MGENVDLIAVGSHGYRGLDRVLGTTAANVVDDADRSVLVLRVRRSSTSCWPIDVVHIKEDS